MKSYILITIALFFGLFANQTFAQTKRNYIVITSNIEQLKPIILAAKGLAKEDGPNFGKFEVVLCGKAVTGLTEGEKILPVLEMADKESVRLIACGLSLSKFNMNKDSIPKQVKVVDNGLLYDFQLQKKGYLSIEL
jgi:intracellular sulfur oxidation DsrE/DsrF family protein